MPAKTLMTDAPVETIDAGEFGAWLLAMTLTLQGHGDNAVPCGDCTGCCSAAWPVALREEDRDLLPLVPAAYLLTVDNAPPGVRYMGYRSDGTCPMLVEQRCTVYARRPQTCRDFDCRLFAAAGMPSAGAGKAMIDRRIRAWRFRYATPAAKAHHEAIMRTAQFITAQRGTAAGQLFPSSPIAIAGIAFKAHTVFLDPNEAPRSTETLTDAILTAAKDFDRRTER